MNLSRGTLSFHRLFDTHELGLGNQAHHLTLEEFSQLLVEYDLLKFTEQPSLVQAQHSSQQPPQQPFPQPVLPKTQFHDIPRPEMSVQGELGMAIQNCAQFTTKQGVRWYARPGIVHLYFQRAGSA